MTQTWKIDANILDVWMASLTEDLPTAYLMLWAQSEDTRVNLGMRMYVCVYVCMYIYIYIYEYMMHVHKNM
jgi:hypothetical protein